MPSTLNIIPYSWKLMRYEIGAKKINAKEINAADELCLKFLNEIIAVATIRFQNV